MRSTAIPNKQLEFWFEFASNYSYLSVMRIEKLAATHGVSIVWCPFLLGPIFKSFGWDTSPFVLQKEKGAYMWNDMVRQCQKYGVPWTRPTEFPRLSVLPARVALIGAEQPWIGAYCTRVMLRNFCEDKDIQSEDSVRDILLSLGLDAIAILGAAQHENNKMRLRTQTEAARAQGIFGAPTFFAGNEMFWGNDRLEDAFQFAAR